MINSWVVREEKEAKGQLAGSKGIAGFIWTFQHYAAQSPALWAMTFILAETAVSTQGSFGTDILIHHSYVTLLNIHQTTQTCSFSQRAVQENVLSAMI